MTPERLAEITAKIKLGLRYSKRQYVDELQAEVERLVSHNARLQAELDELRRRLDALGKIDWGRVGE